MIRAQVNHSQAEGSYLVSLSGDGFNSTFEFGGTPDEIRALLSEILAGLADALHYEAGAAGSSSEEGL